MAGALTGAPRITGFTHWFRCRIWPLSPNTELNLVDRVLGEVEKNSSIALPGKRGYGGKCPQNCVSLPGGGSVELNSNGSKRRA